VLYDYQKPTYDLPGIVLNHLPTATGLVVDVGCGNGRYVHRLRSDRPDLTTVGLDIAPGILQEVPAPVVVADVSALPFADNAAIAVLAMHMLYHATDTDAALAELARVVQPDGVLIASTNAQDDKHELDDVWSGAAAEVLGIAAGPRRISLSSRFPLDDAPIRLSRYFEDVRLIELPGSITVTEPDPVLAHLASYRAWAAQAGVPFDETLQRVRERLTRSIARNGRFVISCHGGIVVCTGRR
jgi:SAM-dependent methyltransferase